MGSRDYLSMSSMSSSGTMVDEFPTSSLTPKKETGVSNFLTKFPECDGRGTILAIFDSGVDPGAPGMRITTTGERKVIERYDCSGAGDVDTSTIRRMNENREIVGVGGRSLKIPEDWKNPVGEWHVGVKPLYELYIPKVKERMEARRKEKKWDGEHRLTLAEASRTLQKETAGLKGGTVDSLGPQEKWKREELEAQVEVLTTMDKKYKDLGPLLDCIVWHDGNEFQIALCPDENLSDAVVLTDYRAYGQFTPLFQEDQTNLSVNVWEDGNKLEIVSMCSGHGTHVASIAAGNFPENPDLNGVAPGAQVISLMIGDNRLTSMETGTALVRAMTFVMQNAHRIHAINMSYGEHAHWAQNGRLGELMKEVIDKHGVTWVASAGNHGPALSTVGTPPWVAMNGIIGVGAYVSPDMMTAEYCLREKLPGMPYTWSSRGPALDGEMGVSVCAPGAAITSVPTFTLRSAQLMNGTSMAAPHTCGCVALLISVAQVKNFQYSPYSIKKALENTALQLPGVEPFAQGHGLVQVEKAAEALEKLSTLPERDVRFQITVTGGGNPGCGTMKGIYLRDAPGDAVREFSVSVDPVFLRGDEGSQQDKLNFRMNLCLLSDQPWVHVPKFCDLANCQRNFNVKIEQDGLAKGVHHAKIVAMDVHDMEKGPVFSLDATVIKSQPVKAGPSGRPTLELLPQRYEPGKLIREYVTVPKGAGWGVLTLKQLGGTSQADSSPTECTLTARFVIHVMSLAPGQSCKSDEYYKMVSVPPGEETSIGFKVTEGQVLEVVIGRWWAEPLEFPNISGTLVFRGLSVNNGGITRPIIMSAADSMHPVTIRSAFCSEEISPVATLKHQVQLLRPSDVKIIALCAPRDCIPHSRVIYELQATYPFTVSRATELTVNCSLVSDTLYEGEYESQLWMLFDTHKRYLAAGDAYPSKWAAKVEKGDFTIRFHLRHEKREALEKFLGVTPNGTTTTTASNAVSWSGDSQIPTLPILLSAKLPSALNLDVYQSQWETQDWKGTKKGSGWSLTLKKDQALHAFINSFIPDKSLKTLPLTSTVYLQGTFTAPKDEQGKKLCVVPLKVCIPEPAPKQKNASKDQDKDKSKMDEMTEQLRDIQISWLTKLDGLDDSRNLYIRLCQDFDSHLPLHVARLQSLDSIPSPFSTASVSSGSESLDEEKKDVSGKDKPIKTVGICQEIVSLADKVLSMVDRPALLAYYGTKSGSTTAAADSSKTKQAMDKQKSAVVEALIKKGLALTMLHKLDAQNPGCVIPQVTVEDVDQVALDLLKFVDSNESRAVEFYADHALVRGEHGRAIRLLYKWIENDSSKWSGDIDKKITDASTELGWNHVAWYWKWHSECRSFKDFRQF